jgi:hypothetical protein
MPQFRPRKGCQWSEILFDLSARTSCIEEELQTEIHAEFNNETVNEINSGSIDFDTMPLPTSVNLCNLEIVGETEISAEIDNKTVNEIISESAVIHAMQFK